MTTLRLGLVGWLAGMVAYIGGLGILYQEWHVLSGDFVAVAFTSFFAFWLCYWIVYLPVLRLARRVVPRTWGLWTFPVIGMLLGVVPTAAIARFWGGSFGALLAPEALLFLILFTVVGLVVGVGFAFLDPA
jgi:hypothetical protein